MNLGEEGRERPEQKVFLEFKHIGVEATVRISVSLDIEEKFPLPARLRLLRIADELEKRARRFLEPLVAVDNVVDRYGSIVRFYL